MASYDNVDSVKALSATEINRLTAAQLKCALRTIVAHQPDEGQPSNSELLEEIRNIREDLAVMKEMKKEIESLSTRLDEAYKIIHQQNRFLESLDAKERVRNVVITGVSEGEDDLGSTDGEKIKTVLEAAGYAGPIRTEVWVTKRLGQPDERRKRPIHVTLESQDQRSGILRVAKNLKGNGGEFARIYVKKDVHPAARREMARLRTREDEEKRKPDNQGVEIRYDWQRRALLRDGVVIDRYFPNFGMERSGMRS